MKNNKLCPYRTGTIIYHNDKKNYMVPKYGINKRINYDVVDVLFKDCVEEQCMLYDEYKKICKLSNMDRIP